MWSELLECVASKFGSASEFDDDGKFPSVLLSSSLLSELHECKLGWFDSEFDDDDVDDGRFPSVLWLASSPLQQLKI